MAEVQPQSAHFLWEPPLGRNCLFLLWPLVTKVRRSRQMDLRIAHLTEATQRIADGEARIRRQQALVEELRAHGETVGHVTRDSEKLLALFRRTLAGWKGCRDLIEESISRLDQA